MDEWRTKSAAEIGRAIAGGRVDPVALADAFLDAIASHEHGARIYARTMPERARAEARAARARVRKGTPAGPLDGVPVSWKDLFDTAGTATEAGSALLRGRVPDVDAPVVSRASEAGLVALGKTHLSELAFSGLGLNPITATAPNVHDPALVAGGSSSGAAASVAWGLAAAAWGSDTGGSVRIPAAWNDLVGLKTTAGLIPTGGAVPLARTLDTVGPLTRTVEDAALMHHAVTGDATPLGDVNVGGERLLVARTVVREDLDPAVADGFDRALATLDRAGVPLTEGAVEEFAEAERIAAEKSALVNTEGWREWGAVIGAQPGTMYPMIEKRFRSGADGSEETDRAAREAYGEQRARLVKRIERTGLLLMPTVACTAPPIQRLLDDADYYVERNAKALRNTRLANLLGLCAITVPSGTPMVGLMLVGRPRDERRLLRAGRALEIALNC